MLELTEDLIQKYQQEFEQHDHSEALRRSVMNNGINNTAEEVGVKAKLQPTFSYELKTGAVTYQQKSGRCWLFAALNTVRYEFMQEYNVKDFEFSENYLSFWDRVEKANIFYNRMIETADLPDDDRRMETLMKMPNDDGGQWANAVALIEKYGLVPKYAMPETVVSNHTDEFNQVLGTKMRHDAMKLREAVRNGESNEAIMAMKDRFMSEVYRFCVYAFGKPVTSFDLEYRDKDDNFHADYNLTPMEFYQKYTKADLVDYVVIANAPDRAYDTTYTLPDEDNIYGGPTVKFLNLELAEFKRLTLKQLTDGNATWFACDVLQQLDRKQGLLASDLYAYEKLFDIDLQFAKDKRMKYHETVNSHAMVLTGVNLVDGKPNRWKVENSWGDKIGAKGYFVMDDAWFDDYVYETVINKKYLDDKHLQALATEPIHLDLWDAMA